MDAPAPHTAVPVPVTPSAAAAATVNLPDDLATCQRMIRELLETLRFRDHELEGVRHRLDQLLRRLYGPRAEKIDPAQLLLFTETLQAESATPAPPLPPPATEPVAAPRRGHGRRRLPENLPRRPLVHELSDRERVCPCCGELRQPIGRQTSEQLDYHPGSLFIVEHIRVSYACARCQAQTDSAQVESAPKPALPLERALPGPGLLAHISVSKYGEHLPLHRQERQLERHGLLVPRSTTCDWMAAMAELLRPLWQRMKERVLQSLVIQTDDTPVPVQDERLGRTRQGHIWVYRGDRLRPDTVFDYTPTHSRDGPEKFLRGFRGYLQADAHKVYDAFFSRTDPLWEVGCWAHARRGFFEAKTSDPDRAHAALAWVRRLYEVEDAVKAALGAESTPEQIEAAYLRRRQAEAVPLLADFRRWLEAQRGQVLPKSPFCLATNYALNNWTALTRYTEQGFLAIDNNASERDLRGIGIGRKNYLFFGSDKGGHTAAVHYSLITTCRRHRVEPFAYLRDVLIRLASHPVDQLDELLPDRWRPTVTPLTPLPVLHNS